MTPVILIAGTWGGEWARPKSPFRRMLAANEFYPARFDGWTENVSGIFNPLSNREHRDWIAGGYGLGYKLEQMAYDDTNIICHSHAIAVVIYQAIRKRIPIRRLISVCSPVRADLQTQASGAAKYIGRWRHIAAGNWDPWQRAGELFDGHFGWNARKWTQAHENVTVPGIGHAGLLNDPKFLDLWKTDGHLDFLRAKDVTNGRSL